jgi:DNA polymerase delta subunit 1
MVKFHVPGDDPKHPDLRNHFELAIRVAEEVSKTLKAPHDLEMENMYWPMLMYSKKRYAAVKYESPSRPGTMTVKGIALVRREFAPLTKRVLRECLETVLFERDAPKALALARGHVLRVLDDTNPMDEYVMSKQLRTGYKVSALPHVTVAKKTLERTGTPIPSGTRVRFVYVEDPTNPDGKSSDRAEDPEYAVEHRMTIDRLYYIDHQLRKPLTGILEPVCADPDSAIFGHPDVEPKLSSLKSAFKADVHVAKRVRKNEKNNQREITCFFTRPAK